MNAPLGIAIAYCGFFCLPIAAAARQYTVAERVVVRMGLLAPLLCLAASSTAELLGKAIALRAHARALAQADCVEQHVRDTGSSAVNTAQLGLSHKQTLQQLTART